jgi:hypothetical protein
MYHITTLNAAIRNFNGEPEHEELADKNSHQHADIPKQNFETEQGKLIHNHTEKLKHDPIIRLILS